MEAGRSEAAVRHRETGDAIIVLSTGETAWEEGGVMAEGQGDRKAHLRDRLARGREELLAAVAALGEEELAQPVWSDGHGHWTARELIGHVSYAEAGMLPLIEATLADNPPRPNPDFDLARYNEGRVRRAKGQTIPELLARLETSRRETLALLDRIADADLDLASYHPSLKETNVEGIFRVIAFHEWTHAKDLRAVREGAAQG
jgi:hypothetical protein